MSPGAALQLRGDDIQAFVVVPGSNRLALDVRALSGAVSATNPAWYS